MGNGYPVRTFVWPSNSLAGLHGTEPGDICCGDIGYTICSCSIHENGRTSELDVVCKCSAACGFHENRSIVARSETGAIRVLPLIECFGLNVPLDVSTSVVRDEGLDFSMSSSESLGKLCSRKVAFSRFAGGDRRSRCRLRKQIHSEPNMMKSTRDPAPIAIPAIAAGVTLPSIVKLRSGVEFADAAELLPGGDTELTL
jgi:hypothetical protein